MNVQPPESAQLIGVREKAGKSGLPAGLLATTDSSVVCTMCSKCIEEASETCEGEDALFCEGSCQRWYHRWCVGVCREQFQLLTESSKPFLCHLCTSRKQQGVILELQENFRALSTRDCELPWNVVAAKKKDNKGKGKAPVSAQMSESSRSKNTTPGLKYSASKKPLRACVKGARKFWGTLKSTTVTGVTNTLKVLEKVPLGAVTIKRKYKTARSDSKRIVRWWFVVRGYEEVLEQLENDWNSISIQTAWKLEPLLEFQRESTTTTVIPTEIPHSPCPVVTQPNQSPATALTPSPEVNIHDDDVNASKSVLPTTTPLYLEPPIVKEGATM